MVCTPILSFGSSGRFIGGLIPHALQTSDAQGCPGYSLLLFPDRGRSCASSVKGRKTKCFSPSIPLLRVSSCCDRRARPTCGLCSFPLPRVAHLPGRVYLHLPCRRSARRAADLYRDTVVRSRTLGRARQSTSTSFRLNSIAAHGSRPLRSRDRPQGRGHSC